MPDEWETYVRAQRDKRQGSRSYRWSAEAGHVRSLLFIFFGLVGVVALTTLIIVETFR